MEFLNLLQTYLPHLLIGTTALLLFIQLYYILFVYAKLASYKIPNEPTTDSAKPLSIIICARNEEENLKKNLPKVLNQAYPGFEVILVNDDSEDDTKWLLQDLCKQYPHLKVVDIAAHVRLKHGKKFAVTMGIKASKNEHLVFTDADCSPQSDQWLQKISNSFTGTNEIVLGYSPYEKSSGFLNSFIQFETFHTAMSYLSYALNRNAYMGVGRNMAYTKSLFFKGKGFASHMHISSGDDDLFVNQNATKTNTSICIDEDAHVWSAPKNTFAEYYKQKTRHNGASKAYKKHHRKTLAIQLVTALLFYISCICTIIIIPYTWPYIVGLYLLRFIAQIIVYYPIMKKLQVKGLIWLLPILDIFYYFYISINGFFALFKNDIKWK